MAPLKSELSAVAKGMSREGNLRSADSILSLLPNRWMKNVPHLKQEYLGRKSSLEKKLEVYTPLFFPPPCPTIHPHPYLPIVNCTKTNKKNHQTIPRGEGETWKCKSLLSSPILWHRSVMPGSCCIHCLFCI